MQVFFILANSFYRDYYREADQAWQELCREWELIYAVLKAHAQDRGVEISENSKLKSSFSTEKALRDIEDEYNECISTSEELSYFNRSIRGLANHVGCPKSHAEFARLNLQELRRFNSTQVPFLAKLQNDLRDEMALTAKQQEIITALVFRHLLENLPDPALYKGEATDRWKKFWKANVINEINQRNSTTSGHHPLGSLAMDPKIVDSSAGDITPTSTTGKKGVPYKIGSELYGLLSTNIHEYRANARENYQVRNDQWGESIRKILKALAPQNFDPDGEVDWAAERARY
jgi:hypothetical protein